jgi:hypothetical protein
VQARLAQLHVVLRIEERVLAVLEERLMRVHPRAVDAEDRLRHEGGVQVVVERDVLDDEAAGADVVRRHQHIVVMKIDLVLARGDLVMRGLDVHAHLLEGDDDFAPDVFAEIHRREIEVTRLVVRFGGRLAVAAQEQEELGFGSRHHREAALGGQADDVLQRGARAAGERAAVGIGDVANQAPTRAPLGSAQGKTWKVDRSGRRYMSDSSIRTKPSIDEPSNMMLPSSASRTGGRDLDVLDDAEDVGELKAKEFDPLLLGSLQDLLLFARLRAPPLRRAAPRSLRDVMCPPPDSLQSPDVKGSVRCFQ